MWKRLDGEWLVLMCCDATDVRLEFGACGMKRLDGERLGLMCSAASLMRVSSGCLWNEASRRGTAGFDVFCCVTDARLEWVLVESSVYRGNSWV